MSFIVLLLMISPISVNCNSKMYLLSSFWVCRCVSKKESFAPGTMYKPFGKEAAGTMTLSQFQTLHEKDQETAALRELGLNETEILIWKSHVSGEKVSGAIFFSGKCRAISLHLALRPFLFLILTKLSFVSESSLIPRTDLGKKEAIP